MDIEKAIDGYNNDGYIYCITGTFIENNNTIYKTCKIGKTEMKTTSDKTLSALLDRYSTYIPDSKIYKFIRVSNCHKAEVNIFEILKDVHYKKEHFYFDQNKIDYAFNRIKTDYPDINTIVINSDIITVSNLNKQIRHQKNLLPRKHK